MLWIVNQTIPAFSFRYFLFEYFQDHQLRYVFYPKDILTLDNNIQVFEFKQKHHYLIIHDECVQN